MLHGTGKSYTLLTILCKLAKHIENVVIIICDYKNSSIFAPFRNSNNYYGYDKVVEGIKEFYEELQYRMKTDDEERKKQVRVLLLDEFSSVIDALDNKENDLKGKVAYILNMGREYNMKLIIGMQRADSEFFKSGSRDNFRIKLALGNISAEQTRMLGLDKSKMTETNEGVGEGYLHIDGADIEQVKIEKIENLDEVNKIIKKAMDR